MATRRKFLIGAAAATTGLAGAAGSATAQADTTFELELTEQGFVGRAPSSIAGTTNPTLEVEAGNQYQINATVSFYPEMSGLPARHNLTIRTESGTLVRSNYVFPEDDDPESPSTSQSLSVTFEATSSVTSYLCEEHMGEGGDISVSGGDMSTATPTEGGMDETATPTEGGMDETATPTEGGGGGGETNGGGPGFGVGAAVTALGAATYGALRKNSDE